MISATNTGFQHNTISINTGFSAPLDPDQKVVVCINFRMLFCVQANFCRRDFWKCEVLAVKNLLSNVKYAFRFKNCNYFVSYLFLPELRRFA